MKPMSAEEFVRAWQRCDSREQIEEVFGRSYVLVAQRAVDLWRKGVGLKAFDRGAKSKRVDNYRKLNELAKQVSADKA